MSIWPAVSVETKDTGAFKVEFHAKLNPDPVVPLASRRTGVLVTWLTELGTTVVPSAYFRTMFGPAPGGTGVTGVGGKVKVPTADGAHASATPAMTTAISWILGGLSVVYPAEIATVAPVRLTP